MIQHLPVHITQTPTSCPYLEGLECIQCAAAKLPPAHVIIAAAEPSLLQTHLQHSMAQHGAAQHGASHSTPQQQILNIR
jgi:hypothetical protein